MNGAAWWEALDRVGFEAVSVLVSLLWQSSIVLAGAGIVAWSLRRRPRWRRSASRTIPGPSG